MRVSSALRILQTTEKNFLKPTDETIQKLKTLHPQAKSPDLGELIQGMPPEVNSVLFEKITAQEIKYSAIHSFRSHGPSGVDAEIFRQTLCSAKHKKSSDTLANTISSISRRICTDNLDPTSIEAFIACREIALAKDDNGGRRPVGVGEILRSIIA